ncbi:MAG: SWIM zinc finger family protein [Nitrospirota bacterium]|nr:SWIM zinc finger family protein [Nitrospirota bacterium]
MRNRISCSAKKLSQLEPDMVKSVVGGRVYKLGSQYLSENRVRIKDANESQINADVDGTYGTYDQAIRLKGGTLTTKCSCPASEQPFCRHCVAVLLQYYHSHAPAMDEPVMDEPVMDEKEKEEVSAPPLEIATKKQKTESKTNTKSEAQPTSHIPATELKFHEIGIFVDWVQGTVAALRAETKCPPIPDLPSGQVKSWIEAIAQLYADFRRIEQERSEEQSDMRTNQNRIVSLTQDLDRSTHEAKEFKVKCAELRHELDSCQSVLEDHATVVKERDRYVDQMNGLRGELLRKGAELDTLVGSLKQVSAALQAVTPPPQ